MSRQEREMIARDNFLRVLPDRSWTEREIHKIEFELYARIYYNTSCIASEKGMPDVPQRS